MNERVERGSKVRGGWALLVAVLGGCGGTGAAQPEPPPQLPVVDVVEVRREAAAAPIVATGLVLDRDQHELAFESGGLVAAIAVDEGDSVRRGQVLARLDVGALAAQLAQSEAALVKAERDASRAGVLRAAGSLAPVTADDAETGLAVARANVQLLRHHRAHAVLVADADGVVLRRLVDPGEVIGPGMPALVLGAGSHARVARVGVVDRDVVRIAVGDRATVRLDALPGAPLEGTVREIAQLPTPGIGTFEVEIALPPDAEVPRSGLVARARIEPSSAIDAVLLPVTALVEADGDRASVFALSEDGTRVERRFVRTAFVLDERVAVVEGLEGGERVVVSGVSRLSDGTRVRLEAAGESAP